ncbi:hypothetical protein CJ205_04155 [Dolosicoccus paucivorans]|uniref:Lipopolysaccharide assembly protein A domain-containing protein n=1 Tax=Dolosicoccus paucivorans TaxID=84521 RepID=A0A2N6SN15_9LACT|nr:lipopolysaccharide assembly protein LapA domain-containing protein [Dolosicoccus paucivorans]PMB84327.1 hypothetical protein CJ206_04535 [Dolosicoccus paucivorans]PMC58464.1 hypothetical protein CJ205_04155 [Dolosicoccus paucivorans]
MKQQWKIIFVIILMILVVTFAIQNTVAVPINYFVGTVEVPLVLVILLCLLLGVIIGLVGSLTALQASRQANRTLEGELRAAKADHMDKIQEKDRQLAELRDKLRNEAQATDHTAVYQPSTEL